MMPPRHYQDDPPLPWWLFWTLAIGALAAAAYFGATP